jgi:hypothetical protein
MTRIAEPAIGNGLWRHDLATKKTVKAAERQSASAEAAEGLARRAASEAMAERSEQLAAAGATLGVKGVVEAETALEEADLAGEIGQAGVAEITEGSALWGAAESAGAHE